MDVIKRHRFSFDDEVEQFFLNAANSMGQHSVVQVEGDEIILEVKDDDFLSSWANSVACLETK
jgi:hypothetical protein